MSDLKHAVCACLVGMVLAVPGAGAQSAATGQSTTQQPAHDHDHSDATASSESKSEHPAVRSTGDEDATTMDVEAIEAELDLLVARMNESEGTSKLEAMEKLLTTLVRQHRAGCAGKMLPAESTARGGCCQGKGTPARPDP